MTLQRVIVGSYDTATTLRAIKPLILHAGHADNPALRAHAVEAIPFVAIETTIFRQTNFYHTLATSGTIIVRHAHTADNFTVGAHAVITTKYVAKITRV